MTNPVLPRRRVRFSLLESCAVRFAIGLARVLARQKPKRIKAVLCRVRTAARAATAVEATRARDCVLTASPRCCGGRACLVRSLASTLLCRMYGVWPAWRVGVLVTPPFTAHAWIEAEGQLIGEALDGTCYRPLMTVGPVNQP